MEVEELAAAARRGDAPEALSLAIIVAALRKLLEADERGETYISQAADGGYRFAAPVQYCRRPKRRRVPACSTKLARWCRGRSWWSAAAHRRGVGNW